VNTPLCSVCLKNYPLLCGNCQEKVDSGEVSPLDIKVARFLIGLEGRFPDLKNATFHRAFEADGVVIVMVGRGDLRRFLGPQGRILRLLQEELKADVRFVEESRNPQNIIRDLLRPVRILGVNTVWLPDDSFERKVRISARDRNRVPLSLEKLEKIVYELTGERVRIVFD